MINENAHYDHEEHGHVRVVDVSHGDGDGDGDGDGEVAFEHTSETVRVDGDSIPKAWTEPIDQFADRADPADVTVGASSESMGLK